MCRVKTFFWCLWVLLFGGVFSSCSSVGLLTPTRTTLFPESDRAGALGPKVGEVVENPTLTTPSGEPAARPLVPGYWNDSVLLSGSPKIVIDVAKQRAFFYKGSTVVGEAPVSTGKYGRGTPKGTYSVAEKTFVRYSSAYGVVRNNKTHEIVMPDFSTKKDVLPAGCYYEPARMAYCLRFFNGYAFHQGYVPGVPASHGCVRIVEDMAPYFYKAAHVGMPFIVK